MPRVRSSGPPALSDAVAFYLVTGRFAPTGRYATHWDALMLHPTPAFRERHREELAAWARAHPECWAEARALAAEDDDDEDDLYLTPPEEGSP